MHCVSRLPTPVWAMAIHDLGMLNPQFSGTPRCCRTIPVVVRRHSPTSASAAFFFFCVFFPYPNARRTGRLCATAGTSPLRCGASCARESGSVIDCGLPQLERCARAGGWRSSSPLRSALAARTAARRRQFFGLRPPRRDGRFCLVESRAHVHRGQLRRASARWKQPSECSSSSSGSRITERGADRGRRSPTSSPFASRCRRWQTPRSGERLVCAAGDRCATAA